MNATNRAANRIILFITGLILLAAGGAATLASVWPVATRVWEDWMTIAVSWMRDAEHATRISEATTVSWFIVGVLALLAGLIVWAIVVIARLGGGRTRVVIRDENGEGAQGPVVIRRGFMSDALTHSLASRAEILSSHLSASNVRGADVVHLSVTPRQNTSPADVATTLIRMLDNLETLTGRQMPTLISIRSGVRSRLAADQSRVN